LTVDEKKIEMVKKK